MLEELNLWMVEDPNSSISWRQSMTAPKWPTLAWIVTTTVLPIAALPHVEAQPSPQQSPPAEAAQSDDQAARQERLEFMTRAELYTSAEQR